MIDEDLQVFIPNTEIIEESIKQFVKMYSLRTRKSCEYWLVDIGYWTVNVDDRTGFYERIGHDLRNLHLDLDDDLYFFEGKICLCLNIMILFCQYFCSVEREKSVHIWEHYSISKSAQRKISYLGSWNLDTGFQQMDTQKWIRRTDLEVSFVISYNYIKH